MVSDSVAKVNSAEEGSVNSVVGVVTRPEETSKNDYWHSAVAYYGPRVLRQVLSDLIQECIIVDGLSSLSDGELLLLLNRSEMLVSLQTESFISGKSLECLVSFDFLERTEFVTGLRYDLALILDCVDDVSQSVKLCYWLWRNDNIFIYNDWLSTDLNEHAVVLSSEVSSHLLKMLQVFGVYIRQGSEDVVRWGAPVEPLRGEAKVWLTVV